MELKGNHSKTLRQQEGLFKLKAHNWIGTLNYIRRFGKTRVGILACEQFNFEHPKGRGLIVTPNSVIQLQWSNQTTHLENVDVITINQLINDPTLLFDKLFVIYDEIHQYLSEVRYNTILINKPRYRIGLTGSTLTIKDRLLLRPIAPVIDYISEEEAIANNWVSNFVEYNLALQWSEEDKIRYIKHSVPISETINSFSNLYNRFNGVFKDNIDLILSCITGKAFNKEYIPAHTIRELVASHMGWKQGMPITNELEQNIITYWQPDNLLERCKKFKNAIDKRNSIVINNPVKLEAIDNIIKLIGDQSAIIFSESTEFADSVADKLGNKCFSYHSLNNSKRFLFDFEAQDFIRKADGAMKTHGNKSILKYLIDNMNKGYIKYMSVVKAVNEGLDIPKISVVITAGGSSNPTTYEQRTSRGKTIDFYNPNKVTTIINLYFDDFKTATGEIVRSVDKAKLMNRQKYTKHEIYYIADISQIFDVN